MHFIDFVIIAGYLIGTVVLGIASRGRQQNADDYFTTSGHMSSFWLSLIVGLSIAATLFSGISFMAYPSVVFSNGIPIMLGIVGFFLAYLVLRLWFLPRYLQVGGTHPYEIIERNYGKPTRLTAAVMFIMLRIGWMAALIYAPVIALLGAAELDPATWFWPLVLIIGLSSTIYTTLGGIRGVIFTDALQFVVLLVGVFATIVFILWRLPVPIGEAMAGLHQRDYFVLSFSLDHTQSFTVWTVIIGMTVANMAIYMADQMSLQRYMAAGDPRSATRSFGFNIGGAILVIIMLAGVGLALAAWYEHVPDVNLPQTDDGSIANDKVFPYFIATQLPIGVTGLLLAAILAATMSSMTSGINALAATLTLDIRTNFGKDMLPTSQLRFARMVSLVVGVLATLCAGLVAVLGDIFDIAQTLLGVFLGPLLGVMVLSVLKLNVNRYVLIVTMILGSVTGIIIGFSPWQSLWVAPYAFAFTFVGALLSWQPTKQRPVA